MSKIQITSHEMPGLYQSSDRASLDAQKIYFNGLRWYLILLVLAAYISYALPQSPIGALASAGLFLITLAILIYIRLQRPDDTWYNGRAVAESVKTRTWRWMMRADPYENNENIEIASRQFISDLRAILEQNKSLSHSLQSTSAIKEPISGSMQAIRDLSWAARLSIYIEQRVQNQIEWYWQKSRFNKRRAQLWFWVSVLLHSFAIAMLLYKIRHPSLSLPIEVIATSAGAALTWLQAKKHNELNSAYALTAHEIILIKGESTSIHTEKQLAEYVVNSETAFSREHTQWSARKSN